MFLNKLGREMIGGCYMHDDIQLLSSDSTGKGDEASGNACKVHEGCNASTNPIPRVKPVDANIVLTVLFVVFCSVC